jgi:hypothetical protein
LSAQGTPLIEPDSADADFSLVTFLWFGEAATQKVIVRSPVDGTGQDEHNMTRLLDTGLWYTTFRLRHGYRAAYKFIISAARDPEQLVETADPSNPDTFCEPRDEARPDTEDEMDSVVALPDASPQPWAAPRAGSAAGEVNGHLFYSQVLDNERRIWVYTPPNYHTTGDPYNLLIVLDGRFFAFAVRAPVILDNLQADNQITPLVAVIVDNPGRTWAESMAIRDKEMAC